jgi:hypothetical protein
MMAAIKEEAAAATSFIAGASVEDNKYSVSVHFRNCSPDDWPAVRFFVILSTMSSSLVRTFAWSRASIWSDCGIPLDEKY